MATTRFDAAMSARFVSPSSRFGVVKPGSVNMRHEDEIERHRIPVDEYVRRSEENLDEYDRVKGVLARGETVTLERSNEYASSIIHSMETGQACVIYGATSDTPLLVVLPDRAAEGSESWPVTGGPQNKINDNGLVAVTFETAAGTIGVYVMNL